jgi:hypothetical protein
VKLSLDLVFEVEGDREATKAEMYTIMQAIYGARTEATLDSWTWDISEKDEG